MTMNSHRTRIARLLAVVALAFGLLVGVPAAASALPPDGPGPETPGTKSKVWPKKVKAGERLNFEVWGLPANETVYIKIDDGNMCKDTSHGACVYHTQKLDKKGHAKGSLVVPNLGAGKHWLRMLATGDVFDSKTGGNTFTVVAGGASDKSPGGAGGGAANADGTIEGGSVEIDLGEESPSPSPSVTPEETATPEKTPSAESAETPVSESSTPAAAPPANPAPPAPPAAAAPVPVAGIAALAGAVVVGGGAVGWALVRRNRLVKLAAAGEG